MARKKTERNAQAETAETALPAEPLQGDIAEEMPEEMLPDAPLSPAYVLDPYPVISVSLSDYRGGPRMHLQRS